MPLTNGSDAARSWATLWAGNPVDIVQAPPGSGESQTVVTLLSHLVSRENLSIVVGTPPDAPAIPLANRLVNAVPAGTMQLMMS